MIRFIVPVLSLFASAALSVPTVAQDDARLTVVELFTSQGCSSCPPADSVLKSLRDRPGILPLSWPVDYWDRLGWEDTFAHPHNSMRQAAYNKRLGRGGVFTPQMIFDGRYQCVGSKQKKVRSTVERAREQDRLTVTPQISIEGDSVLVHLPVTNVSETVSVRTVWFLSDAEVEIGDGENRGRTLHYTNVVRASTILEDWNGEARTITLPLSDAKAVGADNFAILLHDGYPYGPIVGAGSLGLPGAEATGR